MLFQHYGAKGYCSRSSVSLKVRSHKIVIFIIKIVEQYLNLCYITLSGNGVNWKHAKFSWNIAGSNPASERNWRGKFSIFFGSRIFLLENVE